MLDIINRELNAGREMTLSDGDGDCGGGSIARVDRHLGGGGWGGWCWVLGFVLIFRVVRSCQIAAFLCACVCVCVYVCVFDRSFGCNEE